MWLFPFLLLLACSREDPPPLVPLHLEPKPAPAVVLITWDTVRDDHVGSARGATNQTPVFDGLASEGVRFMQTRTVAPETLPAHASLHTGLFPAAHGARNNGGFQVSSDVTTLAEMMTEQGYRSGAFVSAPVLSRATGLDRGFEKYDDHIPYGGTGHVVPERDGYLTVKKAIQWMDSLPPQDPVFIWIHLFDAHRPWTPPKQLRDASPGDLYRAEIAHVDNQTGVFMDALEECGRKPQSLVVVTSDHGEGLGEHGESTHAWFAYESTIRVPLMMWWGEEHSMGFTRGLQVLGPASLVDIVPTLAEIEGIDTQATDGISLLDGIENGTLAQRALPFESLAPACDYSTAPLFGVVDEQSRAWIDLPQPELFALDVDPDQTQNLYSENDAAEALSQFQRFDRSWNMPCDQSLSIDRVAELEALGYLQDVVDDSYGQYTDPKDLIELYELLSLNDGQLTQEQALEKGLEMETRFGMLPGLVIFIVDRLDSLGRHREATEFLVRANSENPARFTEDIRIRKKQSGEKYALAQTIRDTLRATPTHPTALYDLAVTLAWLEEWEESEAMLIEVLAASPQDETARLQLAGVQGARGNTEQALATLDAGRDGEYSAALDCQSARILYRYLDRKTEAKRRLRRCEERGGTLQAADLRVLSSQ